MNHLITEKPCFTEWPDPFNELWLVKAQRRCAMIAGATGITSLQPRRMTLLLKRSLLQPKQCMRRKNKFLAVWDMNGLETLYNLTAWEKRVKNWEKGHIFRILKEEQKSAPPSAPNLNLILLRARVNSQRQYEVYIFEADTISEQDILEMFDKDPQVIVDSIRDAGVKIYSDYTPQPKQLIQ